MSHAIREETQGWRDVALCAEDPELWFTQSAEARKQARALCAVCPASTNCVEAALRSPAVSGIVAGLTPNQLAKMKKQRNSDAA